MRWLARQVRQLLSVHRGYFPWKDIIISDVEQCASTLTLSNTTGFLRDDPYWTSRKNGLKLIKLSSIIKLVQFRFPPVVTLDQ
jgi:hypothetical protein